MGILIQLKKLIRPNAQEVFDFLQGRFEGLHLKLLQPYTYKKMQFYTPQFHCENIGQYLQHSEEAHRIHTTEFAYESPDRRMGIYPIRITDTRFSIGNVTVSEIEDTTYKSRTLLDIILNQEGEDTLKKEITLSDSTGKVLSVAKRYDFDPITKRSYWRLLLQSKPGDNVSVILGYNRSDEDDTTTAKLITLDNHSLERQL